MVGVNVTGSYRDLWSKKGHILTCGYPRSGKGTNIIIPVFLEESLKSNNAPSFVCLDPKGENLAICGENLKKSGYHVIALNPFHIPVIQNFESAHFNPFDHFEAGQIDFSSYVNLIANSILPPEKHEHSNSFFNKNGNRILSIYIRYLMIQDKEAKTIRTLHRWLKYSDTDRDALWDEMADIDQYDVGLDIRDLANKVAEGVKSTNEVMENILAAMKCFTDDPIRECMSFSDFSLKEISNRKTALFICVKPEDLTDYAVFMRILVASIMRGFSKYFNPNRKVVMIMDEFFQMGYLAEFEKGIDYLGQYVSLWPIVQHLSQLKTLYPSMWEGYVGGAAIKHWMVRDNFTAEYLSKRMPNTLVFLGENADGSPRYKEKPLLTPFEIMNHDGIIMEIDGMGTPGELEKKPYYNWFNNYSPNPYY